MPAALGSRSADGHSTTALVAKPAPPEPRHTGRILVLDDELAIAEMLAEMLGLLGYTPTVCNTPMRALELLADGDFDLVISDFRMPNINGRQFYSLATQKKPDLAHRIIFLTGDVVNEETQAFLHSIGNPHIAKPFKLTSVKSVVEQCLCSKPEAELAIHAEI